MINTYSIRYNSILSRYDASGDVFEYKAELDKLYVDLLKAIKRNLRAGDDVVELSCLLDDVDLKLYSEKFAS
jgi:hypothetical protein